jgi:hypothetical protein
MKTDTGFTFATSMDALCGQLNRFCKEHRLPLQSAGDLIRCPQVTGEQRKWLSEFIDEWDAACEMDTDGAAA